MRTDSDELLEFYKRELTYLRRMGAEFAALYPKVAGRLELGADQCPDPHIERLIESFAFLTARIQHQIESEFPRLSTALLGTLYPQFLSPVPSMAVARFDIDPSQGKLTSAYTLPKRTPLMAQSEQGQVCRFRTAYPVTLWPVTVAHAGFESTDRYDFLDAMPNVSLVLRIRIQGTEEGILDSLELPRLRFHITGDRMLVNAMHELLFCHVVKVVLIGDMEKRPQFLPDEAIGEVGFGPEEDLLPYPPWTHRGYRLLHEYFTFPEKFFFFDLNHLERHGAGTRFDVLFLLDQMPESRLVVNADTFQLGCTPVINLFEKTTEPIRLDERLGEYRLMPDKRREKITEIHTIRSVTAAPNPDQEAETVAPFFSFHHHSENRQRGSFWISRRQATGRKDLPGTEMLLSFVDLDFNPRRPPTKTVFAHTLCTNRHLAEALPAGTLLQIERRAPLAQISILGKPTPQISPPLEGETLWRLISHLSLNYLSLTDAEQGLKALREILTLYSFSDRASTYQQISGIREMACQRVVRRIGLEAWRGFCRGIEVTLTFDERLYVGSGAFLLASVLNRFFPLYTSVNSFTQLVIESIQREGTWKRWPPMAGEQIVL